MSDKDSSKLYPYKLQLEQDNEVFDKDSYSFAKNAIVNNIETVRSLSNEKSNKLTVELLEGRKIIGDVYLGEGEFVLFVTKENDFSLSSIYLYNERSESLELKIDTEQLRFSTIYNVDAVFRVKNGCDRIIYFTDNFNKPRQLELDNLRNHYTDAYKSYLNRGGLPENYLFDKWDINTFLIQEEYLHVSNINISPIRGGNLPNGLYNVLLFYYDDDLNESPVVGESNFIPLSSTITNDDYYNIEGNSNSSIDSLYGIEDSNHTISVKVDGLDSRWRYWGYYLVYKTLGSTVIEKIRKTEPIDIEIKEHIFDEGLDADISEINFDRPNIDKAEHIEQTGKELLLSDTEENSFDNVSLQNAASKVCVKWVEKSEPLYNINEAGVSKSWVSYDEGLSLMRGEVYALGVIFIYTDGRETPVYHIPGTNSNRISCQNNFSCLVDANIKDDEIITDYEKVKHLYTESEFDNIIVRRFEVEDTSIRLGENFGRPGFYPLDTNYPNIDTCSTDYWGVDACGESLTGTPIRHHKMPSVKTSPFIISGNNEGEELISENWYFEFTGDLENVPFDNIVAIVEYSIDGQTAIEERFIIKSGQDIFNTFKLLIISLNNGESYNDLGFYFVDENSDPINNTELTGNIYSENQTILNNQGNILVRPLGLQFDNLEYPNNDIIAHKFVIANKTENDYVIKDKGFISNLREGRPKNKTFISYSYLTHNNSGEPDRDDWFGIITPNNLYNRDFDKTDFLSIDGYYPLVNKQQGDNFFNVGIGNGGGIFNPSNEVEPLIAWRLQQFQEFRSLDNSIKLDVESTTLLGPMNYSDSLEQDKMVISLSEAHAVQVLKSNRSSYTRISSSNSNSPSDRNVVYVSMQNKRKVHTSLNSLSYSQFGTGTLNLTDNQSAVIYGGKTFITPFNIVDHKYQKRNETILDDVAIILIAAVGVALTLVTAGAAGPITLATLSAIQLAAVAAGVVGITASIINAVRDLREEEGLSSMGYDEDFKDIDTGRRFDNSYVLHAGDLYEGLFVESRINTGLRQKSQYECGSYFSSLPFVRNIQSYFNRALTYEDEEGVIKIKPIGCVNFYKYNDDYSALQKLRIYRSLPTTFDYCASCQNKFPNRVYYSEPSFDQEINDNYRVFKTNNFKDYPSDKGEITNILYLNNIIYIITKRGIFVQKPNYQEQITSDAVLQIGTGSFLSGVVEELVDDDIGAVGSTDKRSFLKINGGFIFYSQEYRSPFIINGMKIDSLSKKGVNPFLRKYGYSLHAKEYKNNFNKDYPFEYLSHSLGVGCISAYDKNISRLLFTFKDLNRDVKEYSVCDGINSKWPDDLLDQIESLTSDGYEKTQETECSMIFQRIENIETSNNTLTNIYVFYDATSQSLSDATAAKNAIDTWEANYRINNPLWAGNVYHYPMVAQERWVQFGAYPRTGNFVLDPNEGGDTILPLTGPNERFHPNGVDDWQSLTVLHPLADPNTGITSQPINDSNVIVLSFVDEAAASLSGNNSSLLYYHNNQFINNRPDFVNQPRPWYLEDYNLMENAFNQYNSFKGICYPITRIDPNAVDKSSEIFLLHALAAIEGRVLTIAETPVNSNSNGTVNLSAINESNPYSLVEGGPGGLNTLGWQGVFDKNSPANYTNQEFQNELQDLFEISTFITTSVSTEIINKVPDNSILLNQCEKSWTLSYDLERQSWISFHGYLPRYYLSSENNFSSSKDASSIWKHIEDTQESTFCNFYGKNDEFIVEFVIPSLGQSKTLESFILGLDSFVKGIKNESPNQNEDSIQNFEVPIDKIHVYSINQSTGEQNVVIIDGNNDNFYDQLTSFGDNMEMSFFNNIISINNIWNKLKSPNLPIFENEDCDNNLWIDKKPILNNHEYQDQEFIEPIKGNYIKIRLFFSTFNDVNHYVKYLIPNQIISNR